MPSPCTCTAFKLVSRCEDARPEGDQRGANSGIAEDAWKRQNASFRRPGRSGKSGGVRKRQACQPAAAALGLSLAAACFLERIERPRRRPARGLGYLCALINEGLH